MRNSHLLLTRLPLSTQKRTKTTIKVLNIDENGEKAKTHLQRVSTSIPKKKKKTSLTSSAFIIEKRAIILIGVLKKKNKSQKTRNGLGDLHAGDYS